MLNKLKAMFNRKQEPKLVFGNLVLDVQEKTIEELTKVVSELYRAGISRKHPEQVVCDLDYKYGDADGLVQYITYIANQGLFGTSTKTVIEKIKPITKMLQEF